MNVIAEHPIPHAEGNPRNSEGSFVQLKDGRIVLAYTKYVGIDWHDHCTANIVAMVSQDDGNTWHPWKTLVKNKEMNVMSVSLLRLQDGRIAMLYLEKSDVSWHGEHFVDCRPKICFSDDEMETFGAPVEITHLQPIYLVMNNDRLIQTKSGRLLMALSQHAYGPKDSLMAGVGLFYYSDDGGQTWQVSNSICYPPQGLNHGLMEPGLIELRDGCIMVWYRTCGGCQYKGYSYDNGETWSSLQPAPEFRSPNAPLSMKRNPYTGELYAIWNDYNPLRAVRFDATATGGMGRTPLVLAKSNDNGKTWIDHQILEDAPDHGFAYTAMLFIKDKLFLEYCCGSGLNGECMLQDCKIRVLECPYFHLAFWKRHLADRGFYKQVFRLLLPVIVQQSVTNAVNLLDNLMIGQTGTLQMSAVAIVNQILFVFALVIIGALSGPGILSTQFAGARRYDGVRDCFRFKYLLCGVATVLFALLCCFYSTPLLQLFLQGEGLPEEIAKTLRYGKQYLFIMLLGLPMFSVSSVYASTLRECGQVKVPMLASVTALLTNLLGNYALIFGHFGMPALGVVGAAIATVCSRIVEMGIVVIYTHRRSAIYPFIEKAYASCRVPKALTVEIIRKGMPLLINEGVWSLGISATFQCYSMRGLHVIAAVNIVTTIANLFKCIYLSMGLVASIMVGHELGLNQMKQARKTVDYLMSMGLALSVITCTVSMLLAKPLAGLYNVEPDICYMAQVMLYITAMATPFEMIVHIAYFSIRAGGQGLCAFLMDGVYLWCVQVAACVIIGYYTHIHIYFFYGISEACVVLKAFIAHFLIKQDFWLKNLVSSGHRR